MKKCISPFCFLASCLFIAACFKSEIHTPPKFEASVSNPVLSPGAPGSWEDLFLWAPQIVRDNDVFYLFYLGGNVSGRMAVGLATSVDGYHFEKFPGNPVLAPDNMGFDAFTVGPGIVLKKDTTWLMYYNAQEIIAFAPGRHAGRATASSPGGPWSRSETPVISSGSRGEWDAGFIVPSSVMVLEDESYMMFYSGGEDIALWDNFYVGMATSADGINWKKYNNPETTEHPFANSDPVMMSGAVGEWDAAFVWMANVTKFPDGFRMYYSGVGVNSRKEIKAIGYASSKDGVHWQKYFGNPVFISDQDPFINSSGKKGYMENPSLLYEDTICYMYYECGPFGLETSYIGLATARPHGIKR